MKTQTKFDGIQKTSFSQEQIAKRVAELGHQITADYAQCIAGGEELVIVGILRGGAIFTSDLARAIDLPIEIDFMAASSYGNGTKSSGEVKIKKDLSCNIEGKHVILVEDIIDTGLTLDLLRKKLLERGPLSVEIASFLRKDIPGQVDVPCKYLGYMCGDEFFVGYGLDYAERYRNLCEICVLKPEIYQ